MDALLNELSDIGNIAPDPQTLAGGAAVFTWVIGAVLLTLLAVGVYATSKRRRTLFTFAVGAGALISVLGLLAGGLIFTFGPLMAVSASGGVLILAMSWVGNWITDHIKRESDPDLRPNETTDMGERA